MVVICCGTAGKAFAGEIAAELSAAQLSDLKQGQLIFITKDIPESPWPKVRAYRLIHASPEEVTAVFFNYQNSPQFIPNVKTAHISKQNSANEAEIDYALHVPLMSDEHYRTRNTVSVNPQGMYRVDWTLLKAMRTKSSVGHMRVEPFESNALMSYCSTTIPGSSIAFLLKKPAMGQVKDTVEAIAKQVEKEKNTQPQALAKEVILLRAALPSQEADPKPSASDTPVSTPSP